MSGLEIRHSMPTDIDQIRSIYAEPSIYSATLQLPYPSLALWESRMANLPEGFYSLVACRGDEVLAQLGIDVQRNRRRAHAANVGMAVKGSARRTRVGSALLAAAIDMSDKWLALRRLELEVYTDNIPAISLYKKFGFVIEGTMRQYAFREGKWVDAHVMARVTS